MLTITGGHLTAIQQYSEAEYPNECCGAVLGRFSKEQKTAEILIPISNQREESAKHNRFLIRPEEFLYCEKTARKAGLEIIGFYHSHPDHPAEPSQYDWEHALPVYSYIILAVCGGQSREITSWELLPDRSQFHQEPLLIQ